MSEAKSADWIAHVTITDEDAYGEYRKLAAEAVASHVGEFVARGGHYAQMEGEERHGNTVAVFPDFDAAVTCCDSAGYHSALEIAKRSSERELVIVEGA